MRTDCVALGFIFKDKIARAKRLEVSLGGVAYVVVWITPFHLFKLDECSLELLLNLFKPICLLECAEARSVHRSDHGIDLSLRIIRIAF